MAWFRSKTCRANTYNTYCIVPIDGLPQFDSETAWCEFYYNSNDCASIRETAQFKMSTYAKTFYNSNGAIAVFTVIMVSVLVSHVNTTIVFSSRPQLSLTVRFLVRL